MKLQLKSITNISFKQHADENTKINFKLFTRHIIES